MGLKIRAFDDGDIDFALAQTTREGWDHTDSTFRVCLSHDPEGCFICEIDGQRAGMITTTRYLHSAWVGNLIVHPRYRRRGIGEHLMVHAIGKLEDRGIRTFWLEADPMGENIYRRLGFVEQFETPRFQKEPPHTVARGDTERLTSSHLSAASALDSRCFGDDRGRLLRELMGIALATYCVQVDGQIRGFAMALPSTLGVRIGPCVVENPSAAENLIDSILADFPNETIVVGVPGVNRAALRLLESRGFTCGPSSLRMVRGALDVVSIPHRIVAITNGAVG